MKRRLLTLLLAFTLLCSLALPAAALQTQPIEVGSALELAQAMSAPATPRRGLFRARTAAAAEPTRVIAFANTLADGYGAGRVLHLAAWQEYVLEFSDEAAAQRALAQLRAGEECYFIHSYEAKPLQDADCLAYTTYGGRQICAAATHGSVLGCQFHPEKSGEVGLKIIEEFLKSAER